jgi:L,D-transpeptidase catalytic domain
VSRLDPQRPPHPFRLGGLSVRLLVVSLLAVVAGCSPSAAPAADPAPDAEAAPAPLPRAGVDRRAAAELDDLQQAIRSAARLARHVPADQGARDLLLKAEIRLGEGRADLEQGEPVAARVAAAAGAGLVGEAVEAINRFLDAYRAGPRSGQWARWVRETQRDSRAGGRRAILIDKLRRQLLLIEGDREIASYDIDLGLQGTSAKIRSGDEATPEGRYRITEIRGPGQTRFHRALMIDYPNDTDRARFRRLRRAGRVRKNEDIGGLIEIHGQGGREQDWTQGCVALSDGDIDDLAARVAVGTPVTIVGTIPDGVRR